RHTFASQLVMAGAPLSDVAALLGHTSIRMVEKHYGHLAKSHVRRTAAEMMPQFGI
ncbi:MAG: tyrosine-type recombinase/integrase, partial [bacterium]|nr:tyrosine-type recombinase/integrase [bacterium]